MNEYVIGVDLGTSAVKVSAMDRTHKTGFMGQQLALTA